MVTQTTQLLLLPGASPRGGLGWTCPPHFCLRLFLKLMQIRWVFTGGGGRGEGCVTVVVQWGFPVNVWGNNLCWLTLHITSTTIPNCFSVDTQYCPCHRGRYLQFFDRCITNTWGLGSLQNTENEANFLLPLGIQKLKGFQLQGGFAPNPWPGALTLDPTGGSAPHPHYKLALRAHHVCPPHIFYVATPLTTTSTTTFGF